MSARLSTILVSIALGIIFVGCGSTQLTPLHVMEQKLTKYHTLHFSVEAAVAEDISSEMTRLEENVRKKVDKEKLFTRTLLGACSDSCSNSLNVRATITHVKKVGGFARFMIGMFAGTASMHSEVTFVDAGTGLTIGSYSIITDDGGQGDTGTLVGRTAKAIVNLIKTNCN